MGRTQKWLTCENPHALVTNYGSEDKSLPWTNDNNEPEESQISWKEGYIHGDPFEERVIVLGKKNVKEVARRVALEQRGRSLRDSFLTHVERVCKEAEAAKEPVLLMAFCHGDDGDGEMGGLCIGTDPGSTDTGDFLSQRMLAKSLSKTPDVKVSLYLTSCYSGNWVVTPNFRLISPTLVPTVMATAQPDQESWAWEISCSQRHAGGVYTSAFLKELQDEPTKLPDDATTHEARSYQELCQDIISEASRLCLRVTGSKPMFTPEGGHDKFWKRTGIPLADYKKNYDRLEKVPASDANPIKDTKRPLDEISMKEIAAWEARHPEEAKLEFGSRTGGYGRTTRGMQSSLEYLANQYLRSKPGARNMPANTALHNDIELFLRRPWAYDYEHIEMIRSQILYRTWAMRSANSYREWLNLNKVTTIEKWDGANQGKDFPYVEENLAMVRASGLFQRPDTIHGYWGQRWQKPFYYLAYAFAASGYGPRDLPKLLSSLKGYNQKITLRKKKYYLTLPNSMTSVRQMSEIMESTWKKSTTKRKRRSLEDAGLMPRISEVTVSEATHGF